MPANTDFPNLQSNINQTNSITTKNALIAVIAILLVLTGVVTYLAGSGNLTPLLVNLVGSNKIVEVGKLPLTVTELTNPIFGGWRSGVQGTVTAKDSDHFTVQGNGGTVRIFFEGTSLTHLWSRDLKRELKLDELPIGAKVVGAVWLNKNDKENVVGSLFDVENPSNK